MAAKERNRKPRWKRIVRWTVLLAVLYWISAPVTLWGWKVTSHHKSLYPLDPFDGRPPELWCTFYEPVLFVIEKPTIRNATIKPFEWAGVDFYVFNELLVRGITEGDWHAFEEGADPQF